MSGSVLPAFSYDGVHHDDIVIGRGADVSTRLHMPEAASTEHAYRVECAVADYHDTSPLRPQLNDRSEDNDASHCDHAKGLRQSMYCRMSWQR